MDRCGVAAAPPTRSSLSCWSLQTCVKARRQCCQLLPSLLSNPSHNLCGVVAPDTRSMPGGKARCCIRHGRMGHTCIAARGRRLADVPMHEATQGSWTYLQAHETEDCYFESTLVAMPLWCAPSSTSAALPKRSLVRSTGCFLRMLVRVSALHGAALPPESSCP